MIVAFSISRDNWMKNISRSRWLTDNFLSKEEETNVKQKHLLIVYNVWTTKRLSYEQRTRQRTLSFDDTIKSHEIKISRVKWLIQSIILRNETIVSERLVFDHLDWKRHVLSLIFLNLFAKIATKSLLILLSRIMTLILWFDIVRKTNARDRKILYKKLLKSSCKAYVSILLLIFIVIFVLSFISYQTNACLFESQKIAFLASRVIEKYSQKNFDDRLIKMMIDLNIFFRVLKRESFKELIRFLRHEMKIFDRIKFAKMIRDRVNLIRVHILKNLESIIRVSLALDTWSSQNHFEFLDVTTYFIDVNWIYREMLLTFKSLKDQHSEARLTKEIYDILLTYDLVNRLLIVTTDNAINNEKLRKKLVKRLQVNEQMWDSDLDIVNCMTHVMQLVINALLKTLNVEIHNKNVTIKWNDKSLNKIKRKKKYFDLIIRKMNILLFFIDYKLIEASIKYDCWSSL